MTIAGSQFDPGVRQRIQVQRGPSQAGQNERVLFIGYRASGAGAMFDLAPQRMVTEGEAVTLFGEGSQLATMTRAGFAVGPLARQDQTRGFVPEIWAMAVEPPVEVGDVVAEWTLTFAGPATITHRMPIEIGDQSGFISVVAGDTADDIAAKALVVIQGFERNLPATAGAALAVVTLTAREKGEHVNEMFLWVDDRRADGVTATAARSVDGVGVKSLVDALTASTAGDWAVVALNQQDAATVALIKPHLVAMWDENTQRRRRVIMPHGGLLTAAAADAQTIDDWRGVVASTERNVGVGIPWAPPSSARAFSYNAAAALACRLESQISPVYNFNHASLPVGGRPTMTLTGDAYDFAHQAGVSIITDNPDGTSPGIITDPISTATTDQSGITNTTDRSLLPIEASRVVRAVGAEHAIKDAGFAQGDTASDELGLLNIKEAGLNVLRAAATKGWISPISDADVTVSSGQESGSEVVTRTQDYSVRVGKDIIRVIHLVDRAGSQA